MENKMINESELKKIELEILEEIDSICKRHNLRYYIMFGTLIGAIRHNGFIPWDDDIDITMPIQDYYKFIQIFNEESDKKYYFSTYQNDKLCHMPYGKVKRLDTLFLEKSLVKSKIESKGIFVDVIPMFYYNYEDENEFIADIKKFRLLVAIANKKLKVNAFFGKKANVLAKILPISANFCIKQALKRFSIQENDLYLIAGLDNKIINKEKLVFDVSDFGEGKEIVFENKKFIAPVNSDKILRKLYGNYMELPPEKDRVSNHSLEEIRYLSKSEYDKILKLYNKNK